MNTPQTDSLESSSRLIGDIYDAALDPGLWPSVVEAISAWIPAQVVNIFWQDASSSEARAFYTRGISPEFLDLYFAKYISMNPMFPATLFFDVGSVR